MSRPRFKLLVCDLDNTLYDWVGFFVPAFYAMIDSAVRILKCDREMLLDQMREVHRFHSDSEHPYALLETSYVKERFKSDFESALICLKSAFDSFEAVKAERLRLYPGVSSTLSTLNAAGFSIVAHTESRLHAVVDRLTTLKLTDFFAHIYCRERPNSLALRETYSSKVYEGFPLNRVVELSHHQRKPEPSVLREICDRESASEAETVYVGDSIVKDVFLAKRIGATGVWAKYGTRHESSEYSKLVRITHWTPDDVARERELSLLASDVRPDVVLETSFSEILNHLYTTTDTARIRRSQ